MIRHAFQGLTLQQTDTAAERIIVSRSCALVVFFMALVPFHEGASTIALL